MDGASVGIQQFPGFIISQNRTKSPPQKSGELKGNSVHHLTSPQQIQPKSCPNSPQQKLFHIIPSTFPICAIILDGLSDWQLFQNRMKGTVSDNNPFHENKNRAFKIPLPSIQLTLTLALLNTGLEDTSFQQKAQGLS